MKRLLKRIYGAYLYWKYRRMYKKDPRRVADETYHKRFGRHINWNDPKDLIEKIYWLQFNTDTSLWTKCSDKYRMREYLAECALQEFLPQLYGHWDNPDDIDFTSLPKSFVLKANNGCGTVHVIKNKSLINISKEKKILRNWLRKPYGYVGAQSHYLRIKPCIIAEELLPQDKTQESISPQSMIDFKVWCINGEPESIFVAYNRHDVTCINIALFDTKWNPMPQFLKNTRDDVYLKDVKIPKPVCLQKMLEIARILAKPFYEVRVDFYVVNDKPIVGELTFTTGFGYFTDEYYKYLGSKIELP